MFPKILVEALPLDSWTETVLSGPKSEDLLLRGGRGIVDGTWRGSRREEERLVNHSMRVLILGSQAVKPQDSGYRNIPVERKVDSLLSSSGVGCYLLLCSKGRY